MPRKLFTFSEIKNKFRLSYWRKTNYSCYSLHMFKTKENNAKYSFLLISPKDAL